ncbi:MAG: hypothetical protein IT440_10060 [Phycisphaeraceae bacterium]|nr:hypothetical protein [Phycisphaeraceae bacterium]
MHHPLFGFPTVHHSLIHRCPAGIKLTLALVLATGMAMLPPDHAAWLAISAGVLVIVTLLSRLPLRYILWRLICLEPLAAGVAVMSIFGPGGWRLFLVLIAKTTLCLLTMILLASTTSFSDLLRAMQRAKVPALLITTLALMVRYLSVLTEESQRMRRARMSRTFTPRRNLSWHSLAGIAGQLFIRASDRAERVYAAMTARGWQ